MINDSENIDIIGTIEILKLILDLFPKIHKSAYFNRPIISYSEHFTNKICLL